jgi:trans-aconitate methyltransferase
MFRLVTASLSVVFFCASTILLAGPQAVDSEQFLKILATAREEASVLAQDAADLEAFSRSQTSWQSYAGQLAQIREHINKMGDLLRQLDDMRIVAASWQRIAIDRIHPVLRELADNTQLTISQLNANPTRIHFKSYADYISAHRELANDLAALANEFVTYGQLKAKLDHLSRKLEREGQ